MIEMYFTISNMVGGIIFCRKHRIYYIINIYLIIKIMYRTYLYHNILLLLTFESIPAYHTFDSVNWFSVKL